MPTPARISVPVKPTTPLRPSSNPTPKTPSSIPRTKARVIHRRRARGRLDDTDTDEELVREPHTDSDSDSATSTLESESASESESEDEPKPVVPRVPSPSHTPLINDASSSTSHSPPSPAKASTFPHSVNWSEMVAEENANGAADLPVIDFADLSSHAQAASPPPTVTPSPPPHNDERDEPSQSAPSSSSKRKPGQSARQAYLSRLDTDPAYVPTLGQFWSHDDRLLDKDLRSLSGWWRGKWQGRGAPRGRGGFVAGWGVRGMRGRGGLVNGGGAFPAGDAPQVDAPPVDRAWTHDGFEEMKKADEDRRQQFQFRGRGAFSRARAGFRGGLNGRGGFVPAPRASSPHDSHVRAQSESQQSSTSDMLKFGNGTRPWFAMKPERVWTKQFDGYLYFEAQLKPVHGQGLGQGVRVKLPGKGETTGGGESGVVVRLPQRNAASRPVPTPPKEPIPERAFVVKLPAGRRAGKERMDVNLVPEDVTTGSPPPMDDSLPPLRSAPIPSIRTHTIQDIPTFTPSQPPVPPVRRASDAAAAIPQASTSTDLHEQPVEAPPLRRHTSEQPPAPNDDSASAGPSQLPPRDVTQENAQSIETILSSQSQPPVLPPLQTVAPPFQSSPPYGSPYGYAAPGLPLPPGIAVSESGVTYEIATGRAVYLHTPPPPPPPPQMQVPMYNPRPMSMHHAHHGSMHFLPPPHHGHGPSMSISPPAFLPSPVGSAPIFALPRQSSRIEIKAPGEKGKEREAASERPSGSIPLPPGLRTAVNINAEPFTPASVQPNLQPQPMGYFPSEAQQAFDETQQHQHQQSMSYQPSPYYFLGPEGNTPYGYGQQYTSVDAGQPQQYDAYSQQHAVYY